MLTHIESDGNADEASDLQNLIKTKHLDFFLEKKAKKCSNDKLYTASQLKTMNVN